MLKMDAADYGVEEAVSIDGIDKGAITKKLEELIKKGETLAVYASVSSPFHRCGKARAHN